MAIRSDVEGLTIKGLRALYKYHRRHDDSLRPNRSRYPQESAVVLYYPLTAANTNTLWTDANETTSGICAKAGVRDAGVVKAEVHKHPLLATIVSTLLTVCAVSSQGVSHNSTAALASSNWP